MHTAIDKEAATFAVADSSNMYLQAMPWGKFLLLLMHEVLTSLRQMRIYGWITRPGYWPEKRCHRLRR
jgi:hypothetical protein